VSHSSILPPKNIKLGLNYMEVTNKIFYCVKPKITGVKSFIWPPTGFTYRNILTIVRDDHKCSLGPALQKFYGRNLRIFVIS
jgi:hypothetical protein